MLILQQTMRVNFRNCAKNFYSFSYYKYLFFSRGKSKCLENQQSCHGFHSTKLFFFNYASHTSNLDVIIVPHHKYKNIDNFVICNTIPEGTEWRYLGNKSVYKIYVSCIREDASDWNKMNLLNNILFVVMVSIICYGSLKRTITKNSRKR